MNKYQALKIHQGETKSFVVVMNVAEFKRLMHTTKTLQETGANEIIFNSESNVNWIEAELEVDGTNYFGQGFLEFEFDLSNEGINYNKLDTENLDDYDTITINCIKD